MRNLYIVIVLSALSFVAKSVDAADNQQEQAATQLRLLIDGFHTLEGSGELVEKGTQSTLVGVRAADGTTGPYKFKRVHLVQFTLSNELRTLLVHSRTRNPTIFVSSNSKAIEFDESIDRNYLLTPSEFYIFQPNITYGAIEGFEFDGVPSEMATKNLPEVALKLRATSFLFDPNLVWEHGGNRLDLLLGTEGLTFDVAQTDDGMKFSKSFEGPRGQLSQEIVLDEDNFYRPIRARMVLMNKVTESCEWSYGDDSNFPSAFRRVSFSQNGEVSTERTMVFTDVTLNADVSKKLDLTTLGLQDGDRIHDIIKSKMYSFRSVETGRNGE